MPAYIAKKFVDGDSSEGEACDIFRFTYFFTEYASVSSLVMVSVERVFALKYPLRTSNAKFGSKIITCLLIAWLDALLVALLPFIPWDPKSKALSHMKTIRRENRPSKNSKSRLKQWKQRSKATTTMFIVIGVFMICWMPSTMYYYVQNVCEHCFDSFVGRQEQIFNAIVKIMTFANSMTNPVIYWYRSGEFRRAFKRMCRGSLCRSLPSGWSSRIHSILSENQETYNKSDSNQS
ncbi:galanin receptor type 2-like isoform X2 [Xenia sp. Carnegie-2017]|uniref:galanin receptor type 2-like isoform X2 n=1 Tax=Xenia sp. Carnegie-2017 TaxID=2897299 RepID=UPI001F04C769|nr:galanin receptor type 2-like isoform X2 [Xenia sp. Carnegie-2017]